MLPQSSIETTNLIHEDRPHHHTRHTRPSHPRCLPPRTRKRQSRRVSAPPNHDHETLTQPWGPHDDRIIPASMYRRLTTDLSANGCQVIGDLSGQQLEAMLAGGPFLIKVSHHELLRDGWAGSEQPAELVGAMHRLRKNGANSVIVSRADEPALALVDDEVLEVRVPPLEPADSRGAGDSMTAGIAASLTRGESLLTALRVGAACGALNVVHRGLGTGGIAAVATVMQRTEIRRWNIG
ncbi:MAG TPA: PfkB family carbohydrate kinase [Pseudonocardiaceae bacterium]|nr:PfkB family carbohydrate kinase [Pseudonocardiaceae bacterium]